MSPGGTDSSNLLPSSGESAANLVSSARAPRIFAPGFQQLPDGIPDPPLCRRAIVIAGRRRPRPRDVVMFDAVARRHGNKANYERYSRGIVDSATFRCGSTARHRRVVKLGCRFVPGEYYAAEQVVSRHGPRHHPPARP
jgi:hypothetical protein